MSHKRKAGDFINSTGESINSNQNWPSEKGRTNTQQQQDLAHLNVEELITYINHFDDWPFHKCHTWTNADPASQINRTKTNPRR